MLKESRRIFQEISLKDDVPCPYILSLAIVVSYCQRQTFGQDGTEVLLKFIINTALEIPAPQTALKSFLCNSFLPARVQD